MKLLKSIGDFFLKANFLISIGCVALFALYDFQFNGVVHIEMLELVFFSTLLTYNLLRLIPFYLDRNQLQKNTWLYKNKNALIGICFLSLAFIFSVLIEIGWKPIVYLSHIGLLSLLYSFPFSFQQFRNLRAIPFLKIFLIAYVWASVCTGLPFLLTHDNLWSKELIIPFISVFIFIFAITLPFDIRDFKTDYRQGLRTIPGLIGVKATKIISILLLAAWIGLNLQQTLVHLSIAAAASTLVLFSNKFRQDWYFLGLIDGLILLYSLLIFMFHLP